MPTMMAAVVAAFLVSSRVGADEAEHRVNEYQVMAAFLYNFAKFVTWSHGPGGPLVIGIAGEDPFGEVIDSTVRGKTVNGRVLQVRRFDSAEAVHDCHILFVSESEQTRLGDVLRHVGPGVLTVGDVPHFVREGGLIRFFVEGSRVRFQINMRGVEQSGLKIHSQLLSLAAN